MTQRARLQALLRAGAVTIALVTGVLLVLGDHPPEYVVADAIVVATLVLGASLPNRLRLPVLAGGFGFGLGVFTVALGARVVEGGQVTALAVAVAGSLAGAVLALHLLAARAFDRADA